jgi:hypothetical protein
LIKLTLQGIDVLITIVLAWGKPHQTDFFAKALGDLQEIGEVAKTI